MLRNNLYYGLKPALPLRLRRAVRRWFANRKRQRVGGVWPILPGSERPPEGWPGWPEGKQFAFVLTHDVEGPEGLAKCRELMNVDLESGFRASFNFVPEGSYSVSRELREELTRNGFEVGVHDLHHDGKLYSTREGFSDKARRINLYLKEWGAVGFRSGFMLHNLEWAHDLDVLYECSTFDTDPFEPQPDGVGTVFPFWVPRPGSDLRLPTSDLRPPASGLRPGYVELPYTLPQDSTLFLLFRETSIDIWKRKLDWVAERGGMVLLNTHPDYVCFAGTPADATEYPADWYRDFLNWVRQKYQGRYWNPTAREVAELVMRTRRVSGNSHFSRGGVSSMRSNSKPRIWIDLENTPHVPFFEPIIDELRARGYPVTVTARDAFQVCDLADAKGMPYVKIGRHYGKNRFLKVAGLCWRSLQLAPVALRERPALALNHGSRAQILLCNLLRIPSMLIMDYEHSQGIPFMGPTWELVPDVVGGKDTWHTSSQDQLLKYPGIKEDVYAWKLVPDPGILSSLGLETSDLIVTVRPPATEAHYHNPESEKLFTRFMERACLTPGTRVVLLPRNKKQADVIRRHYPEWFANARTVIPREAVDGMNLIWHSDLVVSGGGTMNREAAALGVPVYSIFRGPIGAVDRELARQGRLILVEDEEQVESEILLKKRQARPLNEMTSRKVLLYIVDTIETILRKQSLTKSA